NWKIGDSRLSLNEPFFMDGPCGTPSTVLPMPTVMPIPPPTLKQFKKWQKRQKKMLKKMGPFPANIIPPHAPVTTPLLQCSRAFSVDNLSRQVLDGYVDVPAAQKRIWKKRKVGKCQAYNSTTVPDMPSGPPKSSFCSGYSNGFAVSDLRMTHSAPSTNTSDRSRMTSTTDHSSSLHHQAPSPVQLKNSSNQHLQRIRGSRNDVGLAGTPRRLQQLNLVTKGGGPSATVRHETAAIDEKTSNEVRNGEIGHKSSDINYASRNTATIVGECSHHKVATSRDCDERNYGYRNNIIGSEHDNDIKLDRNIPVKITQEAERVSEKNVQLFSKSGTDSTDDGKIFPTDVVASNPFQRYNSAAGATMQNQTTQQAQLGYFPLKKSADYGSTISSLTQSSNMKTEVSDIDFSWVNDVENRLEREIAFVKEDSRQQPHRQKQLAVQYFGMDSERTKTDRDEAAVVISPVYTATTKSLEVFGECESRKELSQIHSDVRSKAAMFDTEACRNGRKFFEGQATYRYRSRSTPRGDVYIPEPDYRSYDPISSQCRGMHSSNATGHKYDQYSQGCSESNNMKPNGSVTEVGAKYDNSYRNNGSEKMTKQQQQQTNSNYGDEMLQRTLAYDATECYENTAQSSTEKPWRISVAY
ncbi:unnamed protein product, partial [Litomosoides sigmodontis]